jgi:RecB family exonuclease
LPASSYVDNFNRVNDLTHRNELSLFAATRQGCEESAALQLAQQRRIDEPIRFDALGQRRLLRGEFQGDFKPSGRGMAAVCRDCNDERIGDLFRAAPGK